MRSEQLLLEFLLAMLHALSDDRTRGLSCFVMLLPDRCCVCGGSKREREREREERREEKKQENSKRGMTQKRRAIARRPSVM